MDIRKEHHSITNDPIYYVTVIFFILITTALPALLGQPRFLPIIQTLALAFYTMLPLRHRNLRGAILVITLWLTLQFLTIAILTALLPARIESAFTDGFIFRGQITAWFFAGAPNPNALTFIGALIELLTVTLGSLITAGIAGIWILTTTTNEAAYSVGILSRTIINPAQFFLIIPYWALLRTAGYAALTLTCAMPLLTYIGNPSYYWQHYRKLILVGLILVVLGILAEFIVPALVIQSPIN